MITKTPITDGKATEESTIEISWLKAEYQKQFGIDISYLIPSSCTELVRYRCNASGYRFYEPTNIVGDGSFYEHLQKNEWYYKAEKWEFNEALKYIPTDREVKVLEIGAGRGDFLSQLRSHNSAAIGVGIELNQDAANIASARGLKVSVQTTREHAKENSNSYDAVISFQVLEHISNPIDVLADSINLLKEGGKLIVCVPDNSKRAHESIFVHEYSLLNMPPHHQGLWDIPSLSYLAKILPLRLDIIMIEPATYSHHSNAYRSLMKRDLLDRFGIVMGMALYSIARPFYDHALRHLCRYLPAHSILAVYTKQ